ncbi:MAG: hypothetical protein KDA99_15875, partial [Planctomycetales bacterium]|nr:hypothetical protein [Planctomycetales bacterium]
GTSLLQNLSRSGSIGDLRVPFIVSLVMVAVGAVTVLVFAPRPSHGPPAVSSSKGESGRSGATAGADRPAASTSVGGEDAEVTANPKSATSSGPSDESNR